MHLPLFKSSLSLRERCGALELPARRSAVAILALSMFLACSVGAHGQSTAAPSVAPTELPRRATLGNVTTHSNVGPMTDFSCQTQGQVLISRERTHDSLPVRTTYKCATVYLDGKAVSVGNPAKGERHSEEYGEFTAALNRVITHVRQDGTQTSNATTILGDSRLFTDQGATLNIRPDPDCCTVSTPNAAMECPAGMAMTGRRQLLEFRCAEIWSGNRPPTGARGTLIARGAGRQGEEPYSCTMQAPEGPTGEVWTYNFTGRDSPCLNYKIASIEMERMDSATRILLTDNERCLKIDDFWIELRTTSKSVTASLMNLDELLTYPINTVVKPGVMLTGKHIKSGSAAVERLSCVRITTSSAPPSS